MPHFNSLSKRGIILALFLVALVLSACAPTYSPRAVPSAVYSFKLIKPAPSGDLTYEDGSIRIAFDINPGQIKFDLKNKTGTPLRVDWNNISYIDPEGVSHRVVHSGVRLLNKAMSVPATLIPPGTKIQEMIFPADFIGYESGTYQGWANSPLLPGDSELAKEYQGKKMEIFMPLEINGQTEDYRFTFSISVQW